MALPATDGFAAANGTALTTYSASWTNNGSTFAIFSNALRCSNAAEGAAHWNADTFSNDQYATATVVAITNVSYIGVSVRCHATATTFYGFEANSNDASYLFKYVAGVSTQLGSTGAVFTVTDVLRLEASGTTITPKVDGSTLNPPGAQTDSSISSGFAGVVGAGSDTGSRIDNWEGGNLGGGGGIVHPVVSSAGIASVIFGGQVVR